MGNRDTKHERITSGLNIRTSIGDPVHGTVNAEGVLSAIATRRSDKQLVAVTASHLTWRRGNINPVGGDVNLYQPSNLITPSPVGRLPYEDSGYTAWIPLSTTSANYADAVYFEISGDIKVSDHLHAEPVHTGRRIIPGTYTPTGRGIQLKAFTRTHGEITVTVLGIDDSITLTGGIPFSNVIRLDVRPHTLFEGDSGSPCFY